MCHPCEEPKIPMYSFVMADLIHHPLIITRDSCFRRNDSAGGGSRVKHGMTAYETA